MSDRPTTPWSAVLFDLDGTLADSVELILHCYRHTMETHLGRALPDERWLATIGTPLREQLREFGRSDDEAAAMLETYVSFQRTVHDGMVRSYPGVADVLDVYRDEGTPVGVVTSKRREMAVRTLECCGLDAYVQVLVGADDVERGKPDPEPVHAALDALGVEPSRSVLFVGDSPFDVAAGKAAGIRTAGALWGPFEREALEEAGADHLLSSLGEMLTLDADGVGG